MSDVERRVREFHDTERWLAGGRGQRGEGRLFRDSTEGRSAYDREKIRKTVAHFDGPRGAIVIAGGGDLPTSHVLVVTKSASVVCADNCR